VFDRDIMIMVNILVLIILAPVNILLTALNIEGLVYHHGADIAQLSLSYYSDAGTSSQSFQLTGSHQYTIILMKTIY